MRKIYILFMAFSLIAMGSAAQTLLYFNDFETEGVGDATIVGSGGVVLEETPFANVFHNAVEGQAIRTNYLLLPNTIFADLQNAGSNELTIAFWVNKGTATDYQWSPIFTAHGAAPIDGKNTWPMLALQTRLVAQVNCAGWSDLTNEQNDASTNLVDHTWLDDGEWHYYTAVFTETTVKIYIDGHLKNSWTVTGVGDGEVISGVFTNGSDLTYISLGGNQAWEWGDADAAFKYDDVAIYSSALSKEQIEVNITAKLTSDLVESTLVDLGNELGIEFFDLSGTYVGNDYRTLQPGIYIKKTTYANGIENVKVIKNR